MAAHELRIRPSTANQRAAREHLNSKQRKRLARGETITIKLPGDPSVGKRLQTAFEGTAFVS